MRLAIFADIHANRQAFTACLEAARRSERVRRYLEGRDGVRAIVRPPRLVNFVTR